MIVAPTLAAAAATNSAASFVVMCSMTTRNAGYLFSSGEHPLDEHRLAVEEIDRRIGHFAMNQQRQAELLHLGERRITAEEIGNAGVRWSSPCRIKLHCLDEAGRDSGADLSSADVTSVRYSVISGSKPCLPAVRQNARAIGGGLHHRGDRRLQVGHDDGARKLAGRMRQDSIEGRHRAGADASHRGG